MRWIPWLTVLLVSRNPHLRAIEKSKIACARKFFAKITSDQVKYDVVDSYGKLMELVK